MKKLIAIALPVLPGKTEQFEKFASLLNGEKHEEFKALRTHLDVHERTFLQETPHGETVIVTLEGSNPEEALAKFGTVYKYLFICASDMLLKLVHDQLILPEVISLSEKAVVNRDRFECWRKCRNVVLPFSQYAYKTGKVFVNFPVKKAPTNRKT